MISLKEGSEDPFCGFQLSQNGAATLLDATIPCPNLLLLLLPITLLLSFKLKPITNFSNTDIPFRLEKYEVKELDWIDNAGTLETPLIR